MTAQTVLDNTRILIDSVDKDDYDGIAPFLIDQLHRELAKLENVAVTASIATLDDTLLISDDAAIRIMPVGLAAKISLIEKDSDLYNEYAAEYTALKAEMYKCTEKDITDAMNAMGGVCNV